MEWPFENGGPYYTTKGPNSHGRSHSLDPFPCYAHDRALATEMAAQVEELFPIPYQTDYYLLEYEDTKRTNGYADRDMIYDSVSGKWAGWDPYIILLGKRIPPHPAMTRYLVAHEYGHIAQWWLEHLRGVENSSTTTMDEEYMVMRPGANNDYGGRKWHANVGEMIANDFRMLVCGVECEFWPHAGFPRPTEIPAVQEFWEKALQEVKADAEKRSAATA